MVCLPSFLIGTKHDGFYVERRSDLSTIHLTKILYLRQKTELARRRSAVSCVLSGNSSERRYFYATAGQTEAAILHSHSDFVLHISSGDTENPRVTKYKSVLLKTTITNNNKETEVRAFPVSKFRVEQLPLLLMQVTSFEFLKINQAASIGRLTNIDRHYRCSRMALSIFIQIRPIAARVTRKPMAHGSVVVGGAHRMPCEPTPPPQSGLMVQFTSRLFFKGR